MKIYLKMGLIESSKLKITMPRKTSTGEKDHGNNVMPSLDMLMEQPISDKLKML